MTSAAVIGFTVSYRRLILATGAVAVCCPAFVRMR